MDDNNQVLVTLNQTGVDLLPDEIESVLNLDDKSNEQKRKHLADYFKVEENKLSRQLLERYAEVDQVITRISAGSVHEDIRGRLVETLLSAKRCYAHAEYRACIELCAVFGEMLANYLCIADKTYLLNGLKSLSQDDQKIINKKGTVDLYFTDKLNQQLRLRWLVCANIIDSSDKDVLLEIHNARIKYFHHWSTDPENAKPDALTAMTKLSSVGAKYLEILGAIPGSLNQKNYERVKQYMIAVK